MDDVLTDFFFEMFCQLKTIGSREVIYHDYVAFSTNRGRVPMSLTDFSARLEDVFNKVLAGFAR